MPGDPPETRLASLEDFQAFLFARGGDGDEEILADLLDTASELISSEFDRQLYPSADVEERVIQTHGDTFARLPDLRADDDTTIVTNGGITLDPDAGDYRLLARRGHPSHAILLAGYHRDAPLSLTITGQWGFDPVPPGVKHGTLVWAARAYFKRQARQADMAHDPDSGLVSQYFGGMPSQIRALATVYNIPGL